MKLNKIEITNLKEIIKCRYVNICLNNSDLMQLTNIPEIKKQIYPFFREIQRTGRECFFKNEDINTLCWISWRMESGYIKIATKMPTGTEDACWSEPFSFKEEGSPLTIYKFMKLKAFW